MSKKLFLTNTLSGKKEEFKSINPHKVGMYNCGPTVYDFAHIGNLRSYIFADILRRALELNEYTVTQVINITDIGHLANDGDDGEDKMTRGLRREGKPLTLEAMKELSDFYTEKFKEDLKELNIELPTHLPKASEHIAEDIELLKKLEEKGFIYSTSDGVYFDTSKDEDYGKLGKSQTKDSEDEQESRIGLNREKRNPKDFAVWKFNDVLGYESPWGKGFPGWHIECSAMSMKYLGETFDIHTGGIDHIPVHHNNEIAQSESATGKPYVHVWLHNAFVNIEAGKMAKSGGNTLKLQTIKDKHISPLAYRYWLLGGRYNTPMNFSWEALQGAQNAFEKLRLRVLDLGVTVGEINNEYQEKFIDFINDDLDTPQALAFIWELLNNKNIPDSSKLATLLYFDKVLGLGLSDIKNSEIPNSIYKLVQEREITRQEKNFAKSDELRKQIEELGYIVKDTELGPKISKK
jgi:cysteinyl-tRNA synthetase